MCAVLIDRFWSIDNNMYHASTFDREDLYDLNCTIYVCRVRRVMPWTALFGDRYIYADTSSAAPPSLASTAGDRASWRSTTGY